MVGGTLGKVELVADLSCLVIPGRLSAQRLLNQLFLVFGKAANQRLGLVGVSGQNRLGKFREN